MKLNPPLLALGAGAFGIGVTEFAPMGLLPVIATDLGVSIPSAGLLISAYALGVVLGAPLMTLATGRVPRRAPAQLDAYGAKELHVLETLLRQGDRKTFRDVADRIAKKIGWTRGPYDTDRDFLSAYYAALRGRLEQKLLMGVRRRDKHDV